jgi:hypothetical protein
VNFDRCKLFQERFFYLISEETDQKYVISQKNFAKKPKGNEGKIFFSCVIRGGKGVYKIFFEIFGGWIEGTDRPLTHEKHGSAFAHKKSFMRGHFCIFEYALIFLCVRGNLEGDQVLRGLCDFLIGSRLFERM